ncbi:hypothetical protein CCZ14_21245, partial [Escherichia coli]
MHQHFTTCVTSSVRSKTGQRTDTLLLEYRCAPDFTAVIIIKYLPWLSWIVFRHCCKVSDEAAFCLIQRPYISKTLLTRRISPRG